MSKKNLAEDGSLITLGLVAVVAAIGEVHRRKGSRATWEGTATTRLVGTAQIPAFQAQTQEEAWDTAYDLAHELPYSAFEDSIMESIGYGEDLEVSDVYEV